VSFEDNLLKIIERSKEIGDKMASEGISGETFAQLSKEYSDLMPIVENINELHKLRNELKDTEAMLESGDIDSDMKDIFEHEKYELLDRIPVVEQNLKISLLPKDKDDEKNAILEIRAGAGGDEAALFASVLFRMYQRYSEDRGWKFEILEISDTGIGGYKEASASISGKGVFARLKFESGVHRVQRVPETETSGRIHTSTATVAVLPEAEEVDIQIDEKDLRIDVFRASGAGGQHVNTTESAVRIVHIPSGATVSCQDEKSQHKNKAKAMKILRARIYEVERSKVDAERAANRKGQVGTGDRSERIRTYNYQQGRVSDHRINLTLYKINEVTNEGQLDEFIDALISEDAAQKLSEEI
jgi:peptide chain release factor 1